MPRPQHRRPHNICKMRRSSEAPGTETVATQETASEAPQENMASRTRSTATSYASQFGTPEAFQSLAPWRRASSSEISPTFSPSLSRHAVWSSALHFALTHQKVLVDGSAGYLKNTRCGFLEKPTTVEPSAALVVRAHPPYLCTHLRTHRRLQIGSCRAHAALPP